MWASVIVNTFDEAFLCVGGCALYQSIMFSFANASAKETLLSE